MCYQPSCETLKTGESKVVHKFELAGLGKAPFAFIGMEEKVIRHPDGSTQAASSCDYCGIGIRYCFWLRSADGNNFKVGCDCIHKAGGDGLVKLISKAERELKDKKNKAIRDRKSAKKADRIETARKSIQTVADLLSSKPHPSQYFADQGKSLLDYVKWNLDNGNELGAVYVERALAGEL